LIIANCSFSPSDPNNGSGLCKVWTAQTLDQVMKFGGQQEYG